MVNSYMRTLSVFTTWHPEGYKKYGRFFIEGFHALWPESLSLTIYAENHTPDTHGDPRITVLDQASTLPKLKEWQARHKDNPLANGWNHSQTKKSFLWDASRFANKTYAVWDFAERTDADIMVWCDGDVRTHTEIPMDFLQAIAPAEDELATYLGRKTWPECGWVMYNRRHPEFKQFMKDWENIYESDDIFNHDEFHDSFIFGELVHLYKQKGVKFKDLGSDKAGGHIFINSPLGAYMDHLKGFRKEVGKSLPGDLTGAFEHHGNQWWGDLVHMTKTDVKKLKMKSPHEYDAQALKSKGKPK